METITTCHPSMTIGELHKHIERNERPTRRSSHAGNIAPKDLAVMAGLPKGVTVLLVDTIKGDDKITKPFVVRLGNDKEVKLTSRSAASERVIGAIAIASSQEHSSLPAIPHDNQSLGEYHFDVLDGLELNNRPISMMRHFSKEPELLTSAMNACGLEGFAHRIVDDQGKIRSGQGIDPAEIGIFGMHDVTDFKVGALLPLPGMIALETLMGEFEGSDETLHLAGGDMVTYTRDLEMMQKVNMIRKRIAADLGASAARHRYIVQDIQNLASFTSITSQHEMLASGATIDLTPHLDELCGVPNDFH